MARVTGHIGLDPALGAGPRPPPRPAGAGLPGLVDGRAHHRAPGRHLPPGRGGVGAVDFDRGTVVAWSFPLRHVEAAGVVDAGGGPVVAVRSTDRLVGGVMLAAAHRVVDGRLVPSSPTSWRPPSTPPPAAGRRRPAAAAPAPAA